MKTKDRKELIEIKNIIRDLDEKNLVLIRNGASLLRDRQMMDTQKKGGKK